MKILSISLWMDIDGGKVEEGRKKTAGEKRETTSRVRAENGMQQLCIQLFRLNLFPTKKKKKSYFTELVEKAKTKRKIKKGKREK